MKTITNVKYADTTNNNLIIEFADGSMQWEKYENHREYSSQIADWIVLGNIIGSYVPPVVTPTSPKLFHHVRSVIAGNGIIVDNTDAMNPIVSSNNVIILPTSDPNIIGALWNRRGRIEISSG